MFEVYIKIMQITYFDKFEFENLLYRLIQIDLCILNQNMYILFILYLRIVDYILLEKKII